MALDSAAIRRQFPIFARTVNDHPLVYLDTAATSQKPQVVLDAMDEFLKNHNGNAHRGMHVLAEEATVKLEGARRAIQHFLGAARPEEILFTKNCTEAINLVARCLSSEWKKGDTVVVSMLEHHSNIVPWLQLKEEKGIDVEWIPCDNKGTLDLQALENILKTKDVRLVSVTAQSNVLGTRPDLETIITLAHNAGALVLIDAAQSIAHERTDVVRLDCDFLAFSGHKVYGPTGVGVLYGKKALLEEMPPFLGGGMMIHEVTTEGFSAADLPAKFEAGTQPLAEAVGLHAAIEWLTQFSWDDIAVHESELIKYAVTKLSEIDGLTILGPKDPKKIHGCVSFVIDGIHPHDLTDILGKDGICLRAGHHCTQPLHKHLKIAASTRLSVGIYNTKEDTDRCLASLQRCVSRLA